MQEVITAIQQKVNKKKVQSLCNKVLKKCSFNSQIDLVNLMDIAYWLYIYEFYDEAIQVCDLFNDMQFTGNYTLWSAADGAFCLKSRILRERGEIEESKKLVERINEHRHPELYINGVQWYRETININIQTDDEYHTKGIYPGWRFRKLIAAIKNREGGNHPIPDEEFESDIAELLAYLKQAK